MSAFADFVRASLAQFRANTSALPPSVDQIWGAAALVALSDAATIAVDLAAGLNFTVTLGGNRTLGNPSNAKEGQCGVIYVVQPASGGPRTLSYASSYKFAGGSAPTLSTAANAVDRLVYFVRSSTHIDIDFSGDRK